MILRVGEMQPPGCCHEHLAPVKHRKQSRTLNQILQDAGISGSKHPSHPDNSHHRYQQGVAALNPLFHQDYFFLYYTSTQSQIFEHFENTSCSNPGLMVSLPHLSLQLFGWYPVFVGFGGFLSVGLGVFWKSQSTEKVHKKCNNG